MAFKKYISKYQGAQFDQAIEYILSLRENSVMKTIESSPANKADLDTIVDEEGIYSIQYYIHSYDDTDESAISLAVIFVDADTILQQYNANGTGVERIYTKSTGVWSSWLPVKSFIQASQNEVVSVSKPTIVFREITDDVDEYFKEDDESTEEESDTNNGE